MWEKRRGFTSPPLPYARVLPLPIEPVSQWTIPEKNKQGGGGLRANLFETPLEILDFSFTPENSKQNKASPVAIPQNCVTPHEILRPKTKTTPGYST